MLNIALNQPGTGGGLCSRSAKPEGKQPDTKPDISIDKFEPTGGRAREDFYFDVTLRNRNGVASGPFEISLNGYGVKNESTRVEEGLGPKERRRVRVGPVNVPFEGTHHYRAHADSKNEVDESNERNNREDKEMFIFDPHA